MAFWIEQMCGWVSPASVDWVESHALCLCDLGNVRLQKRRLGHREASIMVDTHTNSGLHKNGSIPGTKIDDQIFLTRADELTKWARHYRLARFLHMVGVTKLFAWARLSSL
jgi:hypothetical protein